MEGLELLGVTVQVANDAGWPKWLGINFIDNRLEQVVGSAGGTLVLHSPCPTIQVVGIEGATMSYVQSVAVHSASGHSSLKGSRLRCNTQNASVVLRSNTNPSQVVFDLRIQWAKYKFPAAGLQILVGLPSVGNRAGVLLKKESVGLDLRDLAEVGHQACYVSHF